MSNWINLGEYGYRNPEYMNFIVNLDHFETIQIVNRYNQETGKIDGYHITFYRPGEVDDNNATQQPQWGLRADEAETVRKLEQSITANG